MKPMNLKKHLQDPAFRKWAMASSLVLALSASISFNPESKDSRSLQIVSMSSKVDKNAKEEIIQLSNNNKYSVAVEKDPNDKKKLKIKVTRNTEGTFCLDCSTSEETFISSEDITDTSFHTNDKLKALVTNLVLKLENPTKDKQKAEEKKPSKSLTAEEREEKRKDLLAKAKEDCEDMENVSNTLKCATDSLEKLQKESYLDEKGKSKKLFGNGKALTEFFEKNYKFSLMKAFSATPDSELFESSEKTVEKLLELNTAGMNTALTFLFGAKVKDNPEMNEEYKNGVQAMAKLKMNPNNWYALDQYNRSNYNYDQWKNRFNKIKTSFEQGYSSLPETEDRTALAKEFQRQISDPFKEKIYADQNTFDLKVLEAMKSSNPLFNSTSNQATNELNRLQNPNGQIQNGSSFSRDRFYNGQTPFTNGGQFQPNIGTNPNQLFNPNQQAFPQTQFTNTNSNVLLPPR